MDNLTYIWRPRQAIRAVALGTPLRDGKILASAVPTDDGTTKGWRPLGGGIEFGETAEAAVLREFTEELNATACITERLGVMENLYHHEGDMGHEVVFVFALQLSDPGLAAADSFVMEDNGFRNHTAWIPLADFRTRTKTLLPDGLLPLLQGLAPDAPAA